MKVTKLIREYVEEEVCKVYESKQNPYSEQANVDREKIEEFKKLLRNQQQELIDTFTSTTPLVSWYNYEPTTVSATIPTFSGVVTQAMLDESNWRKENTRLKQAKIREIILNLELGANREELKAMIAELIKESTEDNI